MRRSRVLPNALIEELLDELPKSRVDLFWNELERRVAQKHDAKARPSCTEELVAISTALKAKHGHSRMRVMSIAGHVACATRFAQEPAWDRVQSKDVAHDFFVYHRGAKTPLRMVRPIAQINVLECAAKMDDVNMATQGIAWGFLLDVGVLCEAARHGSAKVFRMLYPRCSVSSEEMTSILLASLESQVPVEDLIVGGWVALISGPHRRAINTTLVLSLGRRGQWVVLRQLHAAWTDVANGRPFPWGSDLALLAALRGDMGTLGWLLQSHCEVDVEALRAMAPPKHREEIESLLQRWQHTMLHGRRRRRLV
jgi:hypothetical protein